MKKVLIIPDISGWVMESIANGVISALNGKFNFTKKFADKSVEENLVDWNNIEDYDVVYLMLSGYLPELEDYSKLATSFHGGPGSESQANILQRRGLKNMRMSFVSHQTKQRLDSQFKGSQKVGENLRVKGLIKKLGLRKEDTVKFTNLGNQIKVEFMKKGFGLNNICFTPYGVNTNYFTQEEINENFVCGYAGWIQYLMDSQKDHRRGHWIMKAQEMLNFNLSIAGGLREIGGGFTKISDFRKIHSGKRVEVGLYNVKDMKNYYSKLSCYLVPDKFAGGPMPVLEAGAMGIPMVCTNAGHCGDFIKHGEHGLVVKTFEEFVDAIDWMKKHPQERREMGKNLQSYIREKRTWKAVAPHWENFFNGV